jgi:hypothetical protein
MDGLRALTRSERSPPSHPPPHFNFPKVAPQLRRLRRTDERRRGDAAEGEGEGARAGGVGCGGCGCEARF